MALEAADIPGLVRDAVGVWSDLQATPPIVRYPLNAILGLAALLALAWLVDIPKQGNQPSEGGAPQHRRALPAAPVCAAFGRL